MTDQPTISAHGLVKRFGEVEALRGLDLEVPTGSVLGVLGPNGAGKTTAVRILSTLLPADGGSAMVAGHDVAKDPSAVRQRIGLTGQNAALDEYLTARENLVMFGRLHRLGRRESTRIAGELLTRFDLEESADRIVKGFSGGMQRRLDLAASLVVSPAVLFLDEPTTGLDPRSRLAVWDVIEQLARDGTTVLLTTQYLDEADRLSSSIVVIDRGTAIASGTSAELKQQVGGERVELVAADRVDPQAIADAVADLADAPPTVDRESGGVTIPLAHGAQRLAELVRTLDHAQLAYSALVLRQPTLDDVFLKLTGHAAEDDA